MISSTQYQILFLVKNEKADEIQNHHVLNELTDQDMIEYTGAGIATLSSKGEAAMEEYERQIAADRSSKRATKISICALVFSGIALIISFVKIFV